MKRQKSFLFSRLFLVALFIVGSVFYLSTCKDGTKVKIDDEFEAESNPGYDSLFKMYPPHDVSGTNPSVEELAVFAWRELIALNWQSTYNSSTNQRGTPDANWSWAGTAPFPAQPVVWETYAHRTELSPAPERVPKKQFDSPPLYTFGDSIVNGVDGSNTYFNCLDEDNEIGSCYVFSFLSTDSLMMLYQAKVNRSEYDYVSTYANLDSLDNAITNTKDNIQQDSFYYALNPNDNCNCPDGIFCFPCGKNGGDEGAIEIKTAWRKPHSGDDISQFFHREVIYFEIVNNKTVTMKDTFLLTGIHIIHKTVNMPEFIFATWEHETVTEANENYNYITSDTFPGSDPLGTILPITRLHPVDSVAYYTVTDSVHSLIAAQNPNSVWLHYRLTGTQAQIVQYANRASIPSYFLANFVIESDVQLQDFHGTFIDPQGGEINILKVSEQSFYTMGGCKGCHGRAQYTGKDFSFLVKANIEEPDVYYPAFSSIQKIIGN